MSSFVFSREIAPGSAVDFEVGIGVLFAAEEAERSGGWSRWSVEGAMDWVHDCGVELLGLERLVWVVVDALRDAPEGAGVVEALAVLHEAEVVDLVGPALAQARSLRLVA